MANIEADRCSTTDALRTTDVLENRSGIVYGVDAIKLFLQRREPSLLDALLVHVGGVKITKFLTIRTGGLLRVSCRSFGERAQRSDRIVLEFAEGTVVGAICRNLGRGEPSATGEAVQIILRPHGAIEAGKIQARAQG